MNHNMRVKRMVALVLCMITALTLVLPAAADSVTFVLTAQGRAANLTVYTA